MTPGGALHAAEGAPIELGEQFEPTASQSAVSSPLLILCVSLVSSRLV